MNFENLTSVIKEKKDTLKKENINIIKSYLQIQNTLTKLRNSIYLNIAFTKNSEWEKNTNIPSEAFTFKEKYDLRFVTPEINNKVLEDIFIKLNIIKDNYLSDPSKINESQLLDITYFNSSLLNFVSILFQKYNDKLQGMEKRLLAKSIKTNLSDTINKIIAPYWSSMKECIIDENKVIIFNEVKKQNEDKIIILNNTEILNLTKSKKLELHFEKEILEELEKDFQKTEKILYYEILNKYKNSEGKLTASDKTKIKEALNRYLAQEKNLDKLLIFVTHVESTYSYTGFLKSIMNSILAIITGKKAYSNNKLIEFTYSAREGQISRKQSSLQDLRIQIDTCKNYIFEKRFELEQSNSSEIMDIQHLSIIFKIIDSISLVLSEIFDKGNGLREWIAKERNTKTLKKIPLRLQEDFTGTLLSINQSLIINKQTLEMLNIRAILNEAYNSAS